MSGAVVVYGGRGPRGGSDGCRTGCVSDGRLSALDAGSGAVEWTTRPTEGDVQQAPQPSRGDGDGGDDLVAATNDGRVLVVDPASGTVRAATRRDATVYIHPTLADTDGDGAAEIYVRFGDGRVGAYAAD